MYMHLQGQQYLYRYYVIRFISYYDLIKLLFMELNIKVLY
jgi:hypothetical protein